MPQSPRCSLYTSGGFSFHESMPRTYLTLKLACHAPRQAPAALPDRDFLQPQSTAGRPWGSPVLTPASRGSPLPPPLTLCGPSSCPGLGSKETGQIWFPVPSLACHPIPADGRVCEGFLSPCPSRRPQLGFLSSLTLSQVELRNPATSVSRSPCICVARPQWAPRAGHCPIQPPGGVPSARSVPRGTCMPRVCTPSPGCVPAVLGLSP